MPFAYVTQPGSTLKKRARTLVVHDGQGPIASFGLAQLDSLVLRGNVHLSTPAIRALLRNGVSTTVLSTKGRLLGRLCSPKSGLVHVRLAQYQLQFDPAARLSLARRCVTEKIEAMLDLLARYAGNYSDPLLRATRQKLRESAHIAAQASSVEQLLGVEGHAAATYWTGFRQLNRSDLGFYGRSRRPPRDELNAILSLGYVLLTNEIRVITESLGFDPFLGFYHEPKSHRASLALDVVEPFRHVIVDRMALRLANLGRLKSKHFEGGEETGYRLTNAGWKVFLTEYEERMLARPSGSLADQHPLVRSWRELIQKECLRLRRHLLKMEFPQSSQVLNEEPMPRE